MEGLLKGQGGDGWGGVREGLLKGQGGDGWDEDQVVMDKLEVGLGQYVDGKRLGLGWGLGTGDASGKISPSFRLSLSRGWVKLYIRFDRLYSI